MIIVHLSQRNGDKPTTFSPEGTPPHVRVVIHEPKKRDRLDWSIVNPKTEILHVNDGDQPFHEWLFDNFVFKRDDPRKSYRLANQHTTPHEPGNPQTIRLQIPAPQLVPALTQYDLGQFSFEGSDVVHQVVGFTTENCYADFYNEDRYETVVYMLSTCRKLVETRFLDHLHEQLTANGFVTLYEKKEG